MSADLAATSAVPVAQGRTRGVRPAAVEPVRVAVALARGEARRLLGHPLFLFGFAAHLLLVATVTDEGPRNAFDVVTTGPTFFTGVFTYLAAYLTATRTRRAGGEELLAPLPGGEQERTLALLLAAFAPALASGGVVLAVFGVSLAGDLYVVAPSAAQLAQGPVTVLGAALLGVMVGRWAPSVTVAVVVMVVMIAMNMYSNEHKDVAPLGTYMSWAVWRPGREWGGLHAGSAVWHLVYLGLLCAMAATGAMLRATARPLAVLSLGGALTAAAVLAGSAALP